MQSNGTMKNIYYLIEEQQTGPYTLDQIRPSNAEGDMSAKSPAW
jgi:hypothetical protein